MTKKAVISEAGYRKRRAGRPDLEKYPYRVVPTFLTSVQLNKRKSIESEHETLICFRTQYHSVYRKIIRNSRNLKTAQMSMKRGQDR